MASGFRLRSLLAIILIVSLVVVTCASNAYASTDRRGISVDDGGCGGGGNGNGGHGGGGGGNTPPHPVIQPIPGPVAHLNQLGVQTSGC